MNRKQIIIRAKAAVLIHWDGKNKAKANQAVVVNRLIRLNG
jgi:hypothetical protein